MNKILLDKPQDYYALTTDTSFSCEEECHLSLLIEEPDLQISFDVTEKLFLTVLTKKIGTMKINMNLADNSELIFNGVLLVNDPSDLKVVLDLKGNNIKCHTNIHAITEDKGQLKMVINGVVPEQTKNNVLIENIRVLNLNNSDTTVTPNMEIATNEVVALHNATISGLDRASLFYLTSKGISNKEAESLIKNGFIKKYLNTSLAKNINF